MDISVRAMKPEEHDFSYTQKPEVLAQSGCIGHLRVDMDFNGFGFYSSWDDHNGDMKTQEFKTEFDDVINALRFDEQYGGILKDRKALASYCYKDKQSAFANGREYGFRVDTDKHSYMLRLNPNRGEYAAYIYAYNREMLDRTLTPQQDVALTQLYTQFSEEQEKFKGWLLSQPPEEILNHAYTYCVREDILMSVEDGTLSEKQAAALIRGNVTLDDIEKRFLKIETGHMETIRDTLESAGNEILRAEFVQRNRPLYLHSAEYARQHNELDQYRASIKANEECASAITDAIRDNYSDNRLDGKNALTAVLERFGNERVGYVLANTIREAEWDQRYSSQNKVWAASVPMADDLDERGKLRHSFRVSAHPGLVDLFATRFRNSGKTLEQYSHTMPTSQLTNPKKDMGVER